MSIACSIGVMAYNEESNVGLLLESLLSQSLSSVAITEIIVVSSGSTDQTEPIVRQWMTRDPRISLLVQERREGKASAINLFLTRAHENVAVMASADLLPEPDVVERLVAPFNDPQVGMTACRPVPVNDPGTFMGFAAHLLWNLHHHISAAAFKAGEMVAFRKVFIRIPQHTVADEAAMEPIIRSQGYKVQYVPTAVVHNKGPETLADFLRQRRRNHAGHLAMRHELGYSVSTMGTGRIFSLLLRNMDWRPRAFIWTWTVVALEAYGRFLGSRDYGKRRDHSVWEIAKSTKQVQGKS